jgi:hypothetical protein
MANVQWLSAEEIEKLQVRLHRQLGPHEVEAIGWARANYHRNWRRRFAESLDQHILRKPAWCDEDRWREWYDAPFGDEAMNRHVATMHALVLEGI